MVVTVYIWQRRQAWLRHGGRTHYFNNIGEARQYAESHGKGIWVRPRA